MGGGGKGKQTPTTSPYEAQTAEIAKQTYAETTPIRADLLAQMANFLQGGFDPSKTALYGPQYANARSGMESQYNVARDNVLANTPRGGGQIDALAGVESDRAANVGGLTNTISSNIFNDILQKTYGVAFSAPQQSMAGLGNISNSYASRQNAANAAYSSQYATNIQGFNDFGANIGKQMKPTVICSELYRQGFIPYRLRMVGAVFGGMVGLKTYLGYRILADPVAKRMRKSKGYSKMVAFFTLPAIYEMAHELGLEEKGSLVGKLTLSAYLSLCHRAYRRDSERVGAGEVA